MIFELSDSGFSNDPPRGEEPFIPKLPAKLLRELYAEADWMIHAQPWEEMLDCHSFAIVDPGSGEKTIAAVMGHGGTLFGLHLYLPDEGTGWYARTQNGESKDPEMQHATQFEQRLLEICFTDSANDDRDAHDDEIDGAHAPESWNDGVGPEGLLYAIFRTVRPGCPFWHPDENEARQLLEGLRLLRRYYEDFFQKYQTVVFSPETENDHLVTEIPTFRLPKGAKREDPAQWEMNLERFQAPTPREHSEIPRDDLFVAGLAELPVKKGQCWEVGTFYLNQPVLLEGWPRYPLITLCVESSSGQVVASELTAKPDNFADPLRKGIVTATQNSGSLPAEIIIGTPLAARALQDLTKATGLKLTHFPDGMPAAFTAAAGDLQNSMGNEPDLAPDEIEELHGFGHELAKEMPGPDASEEDILAFAETLQEKDPAMLQKLLSLANMGDLDELPSLPDQAQRPDSQEQTASPTLAYRAPTSRQRYLFRIDLAGIKPPLWRRLSLPVDATFFDLHLAIQAAFNWEGYHLHHFAIKRQGRRPLLIDWEGEEAHELQVKLSKIFGQGTKKLNYCYDFGDSWDHTIKLEKEITAETGDSVLPFEVLKGSGGSPIEDCGGHWGLQEIMDGTHSDLDEFDPAQVQALREGTFDPEKISPRDPQVEMDQLSMRW
jgi:hypothetical protein